MSVKINDTEFKGISYVTNDKSGTWIWEVKPELDQLTQQWVLPEKYRNKPGFMNLMNQVHKSVLPTLLNKNDIDFNIVLDIYSKPRIFKLTLENVE